MVEKVPMFQIKKENFFLQYFLTHTTLPSLKKQINHHVKKWNFFTPAIEDDPKD